MNLNPAFIASKLYIGIKAQERNDRKDLEEWMNDSVITSDFAVESVRARRITGAARHILQNEDLYEIMPSRGVVIFEVKMIQTLSNQDRTLIFSTLQIPLNDVLLKLSCMCVKPTRINIPYEKRPYRKFSSFLL